MALGREYKNDTKTKLPGFYLKFSKRDWYFSEAIISAFIWELCMTRVIGSLATKGRVLRPNDSLGLLTVDIRTCIRADAFLLARASLQIRLQPRAVVASRLLVFPRCKAKKKGGTEEEEWEETSWG